MIEAEGVCATTERLYKLYLQIIVLAQMEHILCQYSITIHVMHLNLFVTLWTNEKCNAVMKGKKLFFCVMTGMWLKNVCGPTWIEKVILSYNVFTLT